MAGPEMVPMRVGGHVVAYRPADGTSATKTSVKSTEKKKATTRSASTAEEATE